MKRKILTFILVLIFALIPGFGILAQDNIRIQVNGEEITFEGQQPIIQDDRTLIPARGVFEFLGYEVIWDSNTQSITIRNDQTIVLMRIGHQSLSVNHGMPIQMDVPPQIINGSTMIPLRAVADALGAEVDWDGTHRLITIIYQNLQPEPEPEQIQDMDYATSTFQDLLDAGYSSEQALDIFEEQIFILTNQERINHGVQPLIWDAALARAARAHSRDMAVNNFADHTGSDGLRPGARAVREGWAGRGATENIAPGGVGSSTPRNRIDGWMNSPGHRTNILEPIATHIGVGVYFISENGNVTRVLTTQKFGLY